MNPSATYPTEGGHKYEYFEERRDYFGAVDACDRWGGKLTSVNSATENERVARPGGLWIGLEWRGGHWKWEDGSCKLDYRNWAQTVVHGADGMAKQNRCTWL